MNTLFPKWDFQNKFKNYYVIMFFLLVISFFLLLTKSKQTNYLILEINSTYIYLKKCKKKNKYLFNHFYPLLYSCFWFCCHMFFFSDSWGPVWKREWPGDPSGVWRSEPNPPGNQAVEPAAGHDPGWTAAIRVGPHRGDPQTRVTTTVRTGMTDCQIVFFYLGLYT